MERKTERIDGYAVSKERYKKHSPCHDCDRQSTKNCLEDGCTYGSVLNGLAAYEDTDLEPEEVIRVEQERDYYHKQAVEIANLFDHKDNDFRKLNQECDYWKTEAKKAMAQLGEYKIAEEQGLYIKLPCKVGDTVWDNDFGKPMPSMIKGFSLGVSSDDEEENDDYDNNEIRMYSIGCGIEQSFSISEIGKTVFITREAAEKALQSTQDKD